MDTYRQEQGVAETIPLWIHIDRSRGLLDHSAMDTYRQEQGVAGPFRYDHI